MNKKSHYLNILLSLILLTIVSCSTPIEKKFINIGSGLLSPTQPQIISNNHATYFTTHEALYSINNDTLNWKFEFEEGFRKDVVFPFFIYLTANDSNITVLMDSEIFNFSIEGALIDRWKISNEPMYFPEFSPDGSLLLFNNWARKQNNPFSRGRTHDRRSTTRGGSRGLFRFLRAF